MQSPKASLTKDIKTITAIICCLSEQKNKAHLSGLKVIISHVSKVFEKQFCSYFEGHQ